MADDVDRSEWGASGTSRDTLEEYWNKLLEKADYFEKEEIKFFYHCTSLTGKRSIMHCKQLNGGKTDLPAKAPLASYDGLKGVWLAISSKDLPNRSPYGTQRMVFRVKDIFTYMGKDLTEHSDSEDRWDAEESDEETVGTAQIAKGKAKKRDKKKQRKANKQQKECYLKPRIPDKPKLTIPLLFFECAHFYGSTQYVRLLLVRCTDPKAEWCRETCKELDIHDNPFLQFLNGRIWTYRSGESGKGVVIEVLLVGDIAFDKLLEPPIWDEVGTLPRAGFDPRLGIC